MEKDGKADFYSMRPGLLDHEKEIIRGMGDRVDYSAGQIISCPEDCPERIHLVESGLVEIYRVTGKGRRVVEDRRGPGDLLGLAEAFCGLGGACYAGAVSEVSLFSVKRKDFQELLACNPFFLKKILGMLAFQVDMPEPRLYSMIFSRAGIDWLYINDI